MKLASLRKTTISVSRHRVVNGDEVRFHGRLLGRPLPDPGKLIELHPELEKRFVESGKWTRLLKPFHHLYSVSARAIESASRWLVHREAQRGTGPIAHLLELHYYWSIRYHFFVGYTQYRHDSRNGNAHHNVVRFGSRRLPDFAVQPIEPDKQSARSARLS